MCALHTELHADCDFCHVPSAPILKVCVSPEWHAPKCVFKMSIPSLQLSESCVDRGAEEQTAALWEGLLVSPCPARWRPGKASLCAQKS